MVTYNICFSLRIKFIKDTNVKALLEQPLNPNKKLAYLVFMVELITSNQAHYKSFVHQSTEDIMRVENIVMYFSKNFFLIKSINNKLGDLIATGIIDRMIRTYLNMELLHTRQMGKERKQLTVAHLAGIFYVCLIGFSLALLVFFVELLSSTLRQKI